MIQVRIPEFYKVTTPFLCTVCYDEVEFDVYGHLYNDKSIEVHSITLKGSGVDLVNILPYQIIDHITDIAEDVDLDDSEFYKSLNKD